MCFNLKVYKTQTNKNDFLSFLPDIKVSRVTPDNMISYLPVKVRLKLVNNFGYLLGQMDNQKKSHKMLFYISTEPNTLSYALSEIILILIICTKNIRICICKTV